MSPDLNSLPPSRPSPTFTAGATFADRPRRISMNNVDNFRPSPPSPHSPSLSSLQAAAAINAGLQRSPASASPGGNGMERRRSSLLNRISINDPSLPAPGEIQHRDGSNTSSPRIARGSFHDATVHERQMSLGELHQELENEQEAQVNRLLYMIRLQQDQLATLSREQQADAAAAATSPTSHRQPTVSPTQSHGPTMSEQNSPQLTSSAHPPPLGPFHRPRSLSRQSSSRFSIAGASSRGASPALLPTAGNLGPLAEDFLLGGGRDECAFYQAETQMLTRENQMLKHRIRELERQIGELTGGQQASAQSPLALIPSTVANGVSSASDGQPKD